jgi:hypothetical protein
LAGSSRRLRVAIPEGWFWLYRCIWCKVASISFKFSGHKILIAHIAFAFADGRLQFLKWENQTRSCWESSTTTARARDALQNGPGSQEFQQPFLPLVSPSSSTRRRTRHTVPSRIGGDDAARPQRSALLLRKALGAIS